MDTDAHEWESDLTEVVVGAAFEVANVIGAGFLKKLYERVLIHELALWGVCAKAQVSFSALPMSIWRSVLIILKASSLSVALLINFQKPKVEWKRVLLDR